MSVVMFLLMLLLCVQCFSLGHFLFYSDRVFWLRFSSALFLHFLNFVLLLLQSAEL